MKHQTVSLFVMVSLALVACGSKESATSAAGGGSAPVAQASRPASSGDATAEEVAREARGKLKCPAKVSLPERAAGAPVDDVLGVRVGMGFDEAANVVLCTNDLLVVDPNAGRGFNIQTYGQTIRQGFSARFAEPRAVKSSRQIMQEMNEEFMARSGNAVRPDDMKPGQSKWYVTTMGLPGQEKVIAAAREEWFAEGKNPTVESVEQALVKKYGTPSSRTANNSVVIVGWAYDPRGRPITETSPLFGQCHGISDPDGGTNFSPDCGLSVLAQVRNLRDNPALAQNFQVGVIDQALGYEAITGVEQALLQMDQQRKAKEVQDAAKNADAPQL